MSTNDIKDKELRSKCHKAKVVRHYHHPENSESYYEWYACQKCNKKCEVEEKLRATV